MSQALPATGLESDEPYAFRYHAGSDSHHASQNCRSGEASGSLGYADLAKGNSDRVAKATAAQTQEIPMVPFIL
jgi:hypothetical protein